MPKSSEIEGLIARIEAATGPDRKIDIDLCLALNYVDSIEEQPLNLRRSPDDEGWLDYEAAENGKLIDYTDSAPTLTASIDAALALVERVLPGWRRRLEEPHGDGGWRASLIWPDQEAVVRAKVAEAPTAPLAILLALFRALSARPRP